MGLSVDQFPPWVATLFPPAVAVPIGLSPLSVPSPCLAYPYLPPPPSFPSGGCACRPETGHALTVWGTTGGPILETGDSTQDP